MKLLFYLHEAIILVFKILFPRSDPLLEGYSLFTQNV